MCIIADNINGITNVKILCSHVAYRLHDEFTPAQLVVYAANIDTSVTNALIFPVYNPGNDATKIIPLDLSHLPYFFNETESVFHQVHVNTSMSEDAMLTVQQVANYKFSIAASKMDFNRIDRTQLNINAISKTTIDIHSDDYSFIIYQVFQKGHLDIMPFGYLCPQVTDTTLIVPTITSHPHNMFDKCYIQSLHVAYKSEFEDVIQFDCEIYSLVKSPTEKTPREKVKEVDTWIRKIKTDYLKRDVKLYVPQNFKLNYVKLACFKPNRNMLMASDNYQFMRDLVIDK